jgi:hypothetical protein
MLPVRWDSQHISCEHVRTTEDPLTYGDEKVANRDTKVWHGATEKGP